MCHVVYVCVNKNVFPLDERPKRNLEPFLLSEIAKKIILPISLAVLTPGHAWCIRSETRQAFSSSYFSRIDKGTVAREGNFREHMISTLEHEP
jgi:hypothetical protein